MADEYSRKLFLATVIYHDDDTGRQHTAAVLKTLRVCGRHLYCAGNLAGWTWGFYRHIRHGQCVLARLPTLRMEVIRRDPQ
ncbi:hypothetical protein KB20921_12880 [Edwardsiella ictaluri]|nr:hypothetical protein KH20906_12590 [Edwardsiella ictaluri]BEI02027.1 hypothetical protein KB20921_12880 [Edwardsiella ictaluri]BEI05496.1 hypothetical protein KH201010_12820 [Edwardsiella ictaluri]BEI08956.1 hypothetical protein STU22726_12870 [Edwardsiella ictaluri]BEI12433.1 hypothetical protein STU22816_12860 [Edwardsiella ictaluri]